MQPRVGCYWYPSYANRKLSTIEVGTCTYMDIAGLCFFDVDDNGRLGWETWDKGANMSCAAVFAATITDLRGALAKVPSLQPKWVFSSGSGALKGVFSNATLSTQLVKDLTNVSLTHGSEIVGGWAMDYETHYSSPAPAAVEGLTHFLRDLKASTGMGINWWSAFLYSFGNLADISAIQPYVDFVEFGSYFSILDCPDTAHPCTNPHTFELEDARRLVSEFGYSPEQILLGIGLTAYSYLNVPAAILPTCALQGSLLTTGPVCRNSGAHESGGGHSDISGKNRTRWDGIQADVLSGRAIKGRSNLDRPTYGALDSYWIFYPDTPRRTNNRNETLGELTFWNDLDDIDRLVAVAKREGYGGVYTWEASSDSSNWTVHRRINKALEKPDHFIVIQRWMLLATSAVAAVVLVAGTKFLCCFLESRKGVVSSETSYNKF